MPCFVFVVRALSPRDGDWVRLFQNFRTEEDAWTAVTIFWLLMTISNDYVTVEVKRTISFRRPEFRRTEAATRVGGGRAGRGDPFAA